ncbi:MAG: GAF domain-containing protein, partial [Terriglobia bacterium]
SKLDRGNNTAVAVHFLDADLANLIFSELLRAKIRTSSALLEIIQSLSPGAEVGAVIEDICRATEQALEAERVLLFLHDPQQNALRARVQVAGRAAEFQIRWGEGLVGKAAEGGQLTNVSSLATDPRYRPEIEKYFDERTRSVLCVPVSKENGVSPGLLVILNKRYGTFTREDEGLGLAVASQISTTRESWRALARVSSLSTDSESSPPSIGAEPKSSVFERTLRLAKTTQRSSLGRLTSGWLR